MIKPSQYLARAKRKDNDDWETGSLVVIRGETSEEQVFLADKMTGALIPVRSETVGRFTGLPDVNNQPIFEGDVLSTENGTFSNTGMGRILCHKGMWTSYYGQDALDRDCFDELHTVCETRAVTGNIHDNPELLGGGNDEN